MQKMLPHDPEPVDVGCVSHTITLHGREWLDIASEDSPGGWIQSDTFVEPSP